MKILKKRDYICRASASNLNTILYHITNNDFFFNEEYQRPYVWDEKNRIEFMDILFSEKPVGVISVVEIDSSLPEQYIEVVDGRQRLTTLMMFFNNEFSYNGYYWKDLDFVEQRYVKAIKFPMLYLEMKKDWEIVPMSLKLEYFHGVNFSGVPQSEEHRIKIEKMLEKENEK